METIQVNQEGRAALKLADPRNGDRFRPQLPYLQQPGFEFLVQQDVEAQDFEAGAVERVAGEAGVVVVLDDRVSGDEGLDDDVLYGSPDLLHVVAVAYHVRVEGGEFPETETAVREGKRSAPSADAVAAR